MSEEMRKEFEEWYLKYCEKNMHTKRLELRNDGEYFCSSTHNLYTGWQASREAMKPIKLPKLMKNTQEQSCYYYNDAIEECKEAIQQAGYKVAE